MSLTDELFSVLESKETDSRGSNSDVRRSKSSPRTHSYLTEDAHRSSSSSLAQPGGSGQDRSRHEDVRGAGRYDRDDHGHRKRDDAGDGLPIDGGAISRRYERRSGSVSSQREPPLPARDGQYVKSDRSEDLRGSKPDPRSSRFHDEPGWQSGRSSQHLADERRKNGYAAEGGRGCRKDYSVSDDAHKFGDKSKRDSYEAAEDLPKKNTLPDKKYVERCAKNCNDGSEPNINGSYENDTRKSAKKYSKGNDNNDEVPYRIINYRKLEEIVNGNPVELVVSLANRHSGFENKLREKLSPDFIMLIMKALAKICKAEFHENKVGILSHACEADFLNQVADYLMKLPFETDENRRSRIDEFLFDILTFCKTTMDLLPDKACDKLPNMLDTTECAMRCVEACLARKFPDALNEGFVDLDCRLKVRIGEREIKHKKATSDNAGQDQKPPPDDFREISIYPTPRDILNSDATFIRPNIVKGAYSSVDHYLDVQFRLLREDFVCPLREGITDYMSKTLVEGKRKKRINNLRIYRKVNFIAPKVVNDVVGLEVCFDSSDRCSKVNWEHNKRFMFGSLLCFTNDNFANIFFGTIVERKVESLKKGLIVVELRDVDHINDTTFYSDFIMAESEVYFEPYFHVLKALKKLQARTFPMRQYIVDVDVRSAAPVYIQNQPNFQYNIDGHNVSVLDDLTWPSAEQLHLDDSQYFAFKSALTKEFVVIQGPPGTGKTYIGLKITEVLLKNSPIWNASNKPILVVCYTNHALDQFLEGILKYTSEIVRAGGQSKSEILTQFNLRERRRKNVRSADVSLLMRDIHSNVSHRMADIKLIQLDLESINSGKGIISLHTLKAGGISNGHLSCFFTNDGRIDDDVFIEWLEIGMQYCDEPEFHNAERSEGGSAERVDTDAPELEGDPNEGIWQNALYDPIDFALDDLNITTHVKFAFLFDTLRGDIAKLHQKRAMLEKLPDPAIRKACFQLDREIREYHKCLNYWQNCVQSSGRCDRGAAESLLRGANLWQLSPNERWTIYSYWVSNLKRRMLCDLRVLERELRVSTKRYEEVKQIGDLHVMKNALVIGMTTTGAARLQPLLQALKPRIVIVEEAAEVLESHIVVSLTSECQHLILIGDHKQLRPSAAVFKLAREYKLEVSLFERMLANGMHCETLKVQHRMRPEIAQLIVPAIYPELRNHESVSEYEHVQGTTKSVFFVAHNRPEEEAGNSATAGDRHGKPEETGRAVNGLSSLPDADPIPGTSASIQQNGPDQACSVGVKVDKRKETVESYNNDKQIASYENSPARVRGGMLNDANRDGDESKSPVGLRWETNEISSIYDRLRRSSVTESIRTCSKVDEACSNKKDREDQEIICRKKLSLDVSSGKIDSSMKSKSPDGLTGRDEACSASENQEAGRTMQERLELLNKSHNDPRSKSTKQTLDCEEGGDGYGRKERSSDNPQSVPVRCRLTKKQFHHDSVSECYDLTKGSRDPNAEMGGNTKTKSNEHSSENESLGAAEAEQAVTVWSRGVQNKLVKKYRVKSSKVLSHRGTSLSELRNLRFKNVLLQSQELHNLRMEFEVQKQEEELKLLRLQQEYWKKKLSEL